MEIRDVWDFTYFIPRTPIHHAIETAYLAIISPHLWTGFMMGILIGWTWKPRWVKNMFRLINNQRFSVVPTIPNLLHKRVVSTLRGFSKTKMFKMIWFNHEDVMSDTNTTNSSVTDSEKLVAQKKNSPPSLAKSVIREGDFEDLRRLLQGKDGGLPWVLMMERSAPGFTYQAWRRDPQDGPTEYKSRTIFEDSTPDQVKDFYWDDAFRSVWDDMLIHAKTLEGCMETGAEIAHWVRKFPFFCSDREYLIGRRIFECAGTFFCITKAVPYHGVPRKEKPLRVDVYYSSWCIRAAESMKHDGRMTACEVTFFHSEDMHIPKRIAKFGVQQGMWGCVKKMEPGLRKYQHHRSSLKTLSQNAYMAQLYTRVPSDFLYEDLIATDKASNADTDNSELQQMNSSNSDASKHIVGDEKVNGLKWLIVGGAVILACTLDRGALGKVLVFGMARRFSKLNRRL